MCADRSVGAAGLRACATNPRRTISLIRRLLLSAAVVSVCAFAQPVYNFDPMHSSAEFSVRHMMMSNVHGEFHNLQGTVVFDPKNLKACRVDATIDVNTLDTREPKRNDHLKSPDFFDAAKYPTLEFKSRQCTRNGGKIDVAGDLTMHGVTHPVVLHMDEPSPEVKDPFGMLRRGAEATTEISRKDWGLVWNKNLDTGGVMVGDNITITLDVEAVRKP